MPSVIKRNGVAVPFDNTKIANAVAKAIMATGEISLKLVPIKAQNIAIETEARLIEKYGTDDFTASVEEIQDIVEEALMANSLGKTAKAYILYRKNHENIRNAAATTFDIKKKIESFTGYDVAGGKGLDGEALSWRRKENSTVTPTLGGLILANSGAMISNYWLNDIYDKEIADAHQSAALHIHDLSMLSGYCAGWSLRQLIQEGLGGVEGRITSAPAKHLSTLCNQMVNFLGIMQNEWAGAQAFSSFDTYLAPFVKVDNLTYKQTKQCIQSFIYGVNTPSRWGTQAPFTNVTIDWVCPPDMKDLPAIIGGKEMDFTYGECKPEMDMVNKAFIEVMIEGDYNGRGFNLGACA